MFSYYIIILSQWKKAKNLKEIMQLKVEAGLTSYVLQGQILCKRKGWRCMGAAITMQLWSLDNNNSLSS